MSASVAEQHESRDAPLGVLYRFVTEGSEQFWKTERIPPPQDAHFIPGGHLALAVDKNIEIIVAPCESAHTPLCTYRRPGDPAQGDWCAPTSITYISTPTPDRSS